MLELEDSGAKVRSLTSGIIYETRRGVAILVESFGGFEANTSFLSDFPCSFLFSVSTSSPEDDNDDDDNDDDDDDDDDDDEVEAL